VNATRDLRSGGVCLFMGRGEVQLMCLGLNRAAEDGEAE